MQPSKLKKRRLKHRITYLESENARLERELAGRPALLRRIEEQEREFDQLSKVVEEKVKELEKSSVVNREWEERVESGVRVWQNFMEVERGIGRIGRQREKETWKKMERGFRTRRSSC